MIEKYVVHNKFWNNVEDYLNYDPHLSMLKELNMFQMITGGKDLILMSMVCIYFQEGDNLEKVLL